MASSTRPGLGPLIESFSEGHSRGDWQIAADPGVMEHVTLLTMINPDPTQEPHFL